ncbi:hypothetical protein D3C77_507240 [compost metagenome]
MTGRAGVFAGLVASDQFQAAQGKFRGTVVHLLQGLQCQGATRRLRRQEEDLVQLLRDHRLEQREQRTECLADARRGLRQQTSAGTDRLVHGLGKLALATAELAMGKRQALQPGVA